ncbi:uncharacterized protein LOC134452565 isoform X2 [Engraulis encrasicolus]|uniref:uncharacterized protein LOC134452565 isoform X2 n=1 Tax=Engraulis encrasicolus TaxID=184585 RepID=UPI002FD2441E
MNHQTGLPREETTCPKHVPYAAYRETLGGANHYKHRKAVSSSPSRSGRDEGSSVDQGTSTGLQTVKTLKRKDKQSQTCFEKRDFGHHVACQTNISALHAQRSPSPGCSEDRSSGASDKKEQLPQIHKVFIGSSEETSSGASDKKEHLPHIHKVFTGSCEDTSSGASDKKEHMPQMHEAYLEEDREGICEKAVQTKPPTHSRETAKKTSSEQQGSSYVGKLAACALLVGVIGYLAIKHHKSINHK